MARVAQKLLERVKSRMGKDDTTIIGMVQSSAVQGFRVEGTEPKNRQPLNREPGTFEPCPIILVSVASWLTPRMDRNLTTTQLHREIKNKTLKMILPQPQSILTHNRARGAGLLLPVRIGNRA